MTYDYICKSCNHSWETEQKITEPKLTVCPNCNKETAERQISSKTNFILSGGGWASSGYSSK